MVQANLPDTVPPIPALAKSWRQWGTRKLDYIGRPIPRGAMAVLKPRGKSSGHVMFVDEWTMNSETFTAVGGNQGKGINRVTKDTVKKNRISEVRWLDIPDNNPANEGDIEVLAKTMWGEARGEVQSVGDRALAAVAHVAKNRLTVKPSYYGGNLTAVCLKPRHFSCWNADDKSREYLDTLDQNQDEIFAKCLQIATAFVSGDFTNLEALENDLTGSATHYHNPSIVPTPSWIVDAPAEVHTATIGKHKFFKNVNGNQP